MKYYTSTAQYNCGIDRHARQMHICVMDRQGKKLVHTNVRDNDFSFFLTHPPIPSFGPATTTARVLSERP